MRPILACDDPAGACGGGDGLLFHLSTPARTALALVTAAVVLLAFLAIVAPAGRRIERFGYVVLVAALLLGGGTLLQSEML